MDILSIGQRVLLNTKDHYQGKTGVVFLAFTHQYQIQLDDDKGELIFVWEHELLGIPKRISKSKLTMLRHLYS